MKMLLLTLSILFLSSCWQKELYIYQVKADWCRNGPVYFKDFNTRYIWYDDYHPYLSWNYLRMYNQWNEIFLENVCTFSYTKTPISDNQ